MILSKSNYISYLKHPAWLWLAKHNKSKLPAIDEDTQAVFDAGHLFEGYAEKLFPEVVKLGHTTNGIIDFEKYKELPKLTKKELESGTKVISQGRIEEDEMTCIFDILEQNDNGKKTAYNANAYSCNFPPSFLVRPIHPKHK